MQAIVSKNIISKNNDSWERSCQRIKTCIAGSRIIESWKDNEEFKANYK